MYNAQYECFYKICFYILNLIGGGAHLGRPHFWGARLIWDGTWRQCNPSPHDMWDTGYNACNCEQTFAINWPM